jgi:predicted GNAT family acetyltransferase
MQVARVLDPRSFRERTLEHLMADEPRHNLMIGVIGTLVDVPDAYPQYHLWLVEDADEVLLVSFMTPPFNLTLSRAARDGAVDALARAVDEDGARPPGVTGTNPELEGFIGAWRRITGQPATRRMAQGIYAATAVTPARPVPGAMRPATVRDRDLLFGWIVAFGDEALEDPDPERTARILDLRLREGGPSLYLWEDRGEPVSLVGTAGPTPSGIRIGPVYTPPEHRRKGYAGALTAAVTDRELRGGGRRYCFLYTDLSNPTSNHVYQAIGYRRVGDSFDYRFEDRPVPAAPGPTA